jgi:hypothetical protein
MNTTSFNGFLYGNLAPTEDEGVLNSYNTQEMILNSLRSNYNSVEARDNEIHSYINVNMLRDKFIAFMNKKNASVFDFLVQPLNEEDTIYKALDLVNRFDGLDYKQNQPLVKYFNEPNLTEANAWLNSILTIGEDSPLNMLKKNINIIIQNWIQTMIELESHETHLMSKIEEVKSIQKKIEIIQLLPVNENLVPVLESLEKYTETAYKSLDIKKYFEDCLSSYKRVYLLQNLMSYIRVVQPSPTLPLCPVCFDDPINICLVPCGHTFCNNCVANNIRLQCAVCRTNVTSKQRIFFN